MTQINKDHLKKVQVICNTELEIKTVKEFLEKFGMAGMTPIIIEEDIETFIPLEEYNYTLADFGNLEYSTKVFNRFKELNKELKIIEL